MLDSPLGEWPSSAEREPAIAARILLILHERKNILARLKGGDRRTIGRADEVAAHVTKNPRLFPQLIAGLWSDDPLVRMRAADATEKVTRENPKFLPPYKKDLLG